MILQKRRRGTAIVETPKGILLVAGKSGIFILPGGGAKYNEGMLEGAVRELREETTLKAYNARYLFDYVGRIHRSRYGGQFQDYHNVFLVRANGVPKPSKEIREIAYYSTDIPIRESPLRLSKTTIEIIERFYQYKNIKPVRNNYQKYSNSDTDAGNTVEVYEDTKSDDGYNYDDEKMIL